MLRRRLRVFRRAIPAAIGLATVFLLDVDTGRAQVTDSPLIITVDNAKLVRGSTGSVTVHGFPPDGTKTLSVRLIASSPATAIHPAGAKPPEVVTQGRAVAVEGVLDGQSPTKITFNVPASLPLGEYGLAVARTAQEPDPKNMLSVKVVRDATIKPVLRSVLPAMGANGTFTLTLIGDGFSAIPEDHVLVFDGGDELVADWKGSPTPGVKGTYISANKITLFGIPDTYRGVQKARLRIGDDVSTEPLAVTLATLNPTVPMIAATVVTLVILLVIAAIVTRGLTRTVIAGVKQNLLTTFLLDEETETLSLSKFQLYVWTIVSLFGYVYLLLVSSLIRWSFEFPEVPSSLPQLLLVSGGTVAASIGATAIRGPKGSGRIQPSVSDFITVGGVVSVERFQFFAWTILGAVSFVFLIVAQRADQFQKLPELPPGFLYLMGASAIGFVGGKFVRKAGPVIDSVTGRFGSVIINIKGRRLSRNGIISIQDQSVTFDLITTQPDPPRALLPESTKDALLEVISKDDEASDDSYCSELRLTIIDVDAWEKRSGLASGTLQKFWMQSPGMTAVSAAPGAPAPLSTQTDKMRVSVRNPDGQMSEWFCDFKP